MAARIVTGQSPSRYQDCHWLGVQRHPADHSRGRSWIRLLLDQPRTDGIYSESPQAGSVWSFSTTWLWPSLDGDLRLGNHPGWQFYFELPQLTYAGLGLLVAASVWNS